jgi:hypothetical protein
MRKMLEELLVDTAEILGVADYYLMKAGRGIRVLLQDRYVRLILVYGTLLAIYLFVSPEVL